MARDTQFSAAPYGGSYSPAGSGQYSLAVPGSYYGPVAARSHNERAQDEPAQDQPVQDESARPAQWPFQSRLELGALPGAVPCARLHARLVLTEWGQARPGRQRRTDRLGTDDQRPAGQHQNGRRAAGLRRRRAAAVDGAAARVRPAPGAGRSLGRRHGAAGSRSGKPGRRDRPRPFNGGGGQQPLGLFSPSRQPRGTAPDERAAKVVWALIQPGA